MTRTFATRTLSPSPSHCCAASRDLAICSPICADTGRHGTCEVAHLRCAGVADRHVAGVRVRRWSGLARSPPPSQPNDDASHHLVDGRSAFGAWRPRTIHLVRARTDPEMWEAERGRGRGCDRACRPRHRARRTGAAGGTLRLRMIVAPLVDDACPPPNTRLPPAHTFDLLIAICRPVRASDDVVSIVVASEDLRGIEDLRRFEDLLMGPGGPGSMRDVCLSSWQRS